MIDDVAYSASQVKRKKGPGGGNGLPVGGRDGEEGRRESRLDGHFGALRGPTRRFKGVLNVDAAEARKARQLGGAAGCQNLCGPALSPHRNRTTTYAKTSFFCLDSFCGDLSLLDEVPVVYVEVNVVISSSTNDNDKKCADHNVIECVITI